jgi:Rrf2 family protein
MLVTTLEGYAVKALIYLAKKKDKRATIREISKENNISFSYILRICSMLRSKGILDSVRGRSGGYILKRNPTDISLYEIIQAVGRKTIEIKCDYGKRKDIPCISTDCLALYPWEKTKSKVDKLFKNISLKNLMEGRK